MRAAQPADKNRSSWFAVVTEEPRLPDLAAFHREIVFLHVIGVFLFLLAHGVSAGVLLRLRGERNPHAVRTLVDLSARSLGVMGVGAALWFFSGILAGFTGGHWTSGRWWIWVSLAIVLVVVVLMTPLGRLYVNRIRAAVGIDPKGRPGQAISTEIDPAVLDAAIMSGRPLLVAGMGLAAVVVLTWLMMYKPF